ncbi:MAG: DNA cytosine methyltransferase [Agitococcus sp.]|nr:DNA cytosine methyltransferase [Agitococcus sp.]
MQTYTTASVGNHRGAPRVWLQGANPARAGFTPGSTYRIEEGPDYLVLQLTLEGDKVVSKKLENGVWIPVIDLNSQKMLDRFKAFGALRIIMMEGEIWMCPLASDKRKQTRLQRLRKKLQENKPIAMGGIAYGLGVLDHALHAGMEEEGLKTELGFANEVRPELIDQAQEYNSTFTATTQALIGPMQEIAFDEKTMARVKQVDVLAAGLPCSGASLAGRAKRKLSHPEDHPLVGHLVVAGLAFIAKVNPAMFVLENVPAYQNTASSSILRNQLRDWGYDVHEREFLATEWGDLEKRNRWCMVAVTPGIPFDFAEMQPEPFVVRSLSDVLEKPEAVVDRWSEMPGLKAKLERDRADGKGFEMQIYTGEESHINTLTKGITKNRSTDPKIQHPENKDLLRIPTAKEHALCKGVPLELITGLAQTPAHEMLGQGICYKPFKALGVYIAKCLKKFGEMDAENLAWTNVAALKVAG